MSVDSSTDAHAIVEPIPRRFWWLKRIAVTAVLIVSVVAVARCWWGVKAWRAYDAEIARIKAAGEPIFPEDFVLPPVPEERNAAPLLVKATQLLNLSQEQTRLLKSTVSSQADLPRYLRELNDLMAVTSAARALVREAGALPDADWGFRGPRPGALVVRLQPYQDLGECLIVAAYVGHLQGDDLETIRSFEDALSLGDHLARHRYLLPTLFDLGMISSVTAGIESIGSTLRIADSRLEASSSTSRPTRDQCRHLAHRLLDDRLFREALRWSVFTDRAELRNGAERCVERGRAALGPGGAVSEMGSLDRAYLFMVRPMYILDTCRMLRQVSGTWVQAAQVSFASQIPESMHPAKRFHGPYLESRYLSGYLTPSYEDAIRNTLVQLARARMAAVSLAIRLYELDYGERPATLDLLVPEYLPYVPTSPLLESHPVLHYEREGDAPKVYFTGPDPGPRSRTVLYLNGRPSSTSSTSKPAASPS